MPGPVPKRSEERIRRNKEETPVDKVEVEGEVDVPPLDFPDPHPMIQDFYDSLALSGQAKFYEPSDWQFARVTCHFLDQLIKSSRPSGQLLATVSSMLTEMLVNEGSRRRVRLEIEREQQKTELSTVSDLFAERLSQ